MDLWIGLLALLTYQHQVTNLQNGHFTLCVQSSWFPPPTPIFFLFVSFLQVWVDRWSYWHDFLNLGVVLVHVPRTDTWSHQTYTGCPWTAPMFIVLLLPPPFSTIYHLAVTAAARSSWLTDNLILGEARSSFLAWSWGDLYTENTDLQGRRGLQ